jgi:hypothetical protein
MENYIHNDLEFDPDHERVEIRIDSNSDNNNLLERELHPTPKVRGLGKNDIRSNYHKKTHNNFASGNLCLGSDTDLANPSSAPIRSNRYARPFNEINSSLQTRSLIRKNNLEKHKSPRIQTSEPHDITYNFYDNSDSGVTCMEQRQYDIQRSSSQLIDEHLQEIQVRINGHLQSALRYENRDRIIGYPVTLLSSFVASALMLNLSQENSHNQTAVDIVGFSFAVTSFVLSLSRDYLKYTTKFQAHDVSSKLYTNLLRSIEVRLIGNHITMADKRDMFKDIVDQMSIIEQYELPIPSDINISIRAETFLPRSVVINHTLKNESLNSKKNVFSS